MLQLSPYLSPLLFSALHLNQSYDAYRNLNKKCISLKARSGDEKGRVAGYADEVVLKDVEFVVSKAGNKRVRREGVKNVHAFARGELVEIDSDDTFDRSQAKQITYYPKIQDTFVIKKTNKPVHQADYVLLSTDGAYAVGARFS